MELDHLEELAAQAAVLIPDAPAGGDALSWLSWRDLVWDVACRLASAGGIALAQAGYREYDDLDAPRVSPGGLLALATRFQIEANIASINPSL